MAKREFVGIRNTKRGIAAGTVAARLPNTGTGPLKQIPLAQLAQQLIATGVVAAPGPAGTPAIADSRIMANISGGSAPPAADTLTAILDHILGSTEGQIIQRGASAWQVLAPGTANQVLASGGAAALNAWSGLSVLIDAVFGSTEGQVLQRGASAWQVLAPGTNGQVLTSGGAGALNSWTTPSAGSFNNRGAWSGSNAYNPFDVVTYEGAAYLNYSAISAPAAGPPTVSPSRNGTPVAKLSNSNATSVVSPTFTTSVSNVIIIAVIECGNNTASPPTVTSVTGTGLTFALRGALTGGSGTNTTRTEVWWALASATFNSTITANFSGNSNETAINVFGYSAANTTSPFDPNVALPVLAAFNSAAPSGTFTTTNAHDYLLNYVQGPGNFPTFNNPPTSFTTLTSNNDFGANYSVGADESVSTIQAGSSNGWGSNTGIGILYLDAVTGAPSAGTPNNPPDEDSAHWIAQGNTYAPGGRLSLTSGVAVQTADVVGGTTIYYVPYIHRGLGHLGLDLAAQISLALDNNAGHTGFQQGSHIFDIFVDGSTGTPRLVTGPAWTNTTTRSAAIDQTTISGLWTNTATMTTKFDTSASTYSAPAGTLLYVGTMYASADGQCTVQFRPSAALGGSNTIVGLFNAYNREPAHISSIDGTNSWSYAANTWRAANNSASNRINWIDGLGSMRVSVTYVDNIQVNNNQGSIGVLFDATTGTPSSANAAVFLGTAAIMIVGTQASDFFTGLGFHFAQAMEIANNSTAVTFYGSPSGPYSELIGDLLI